MQQKSLWIFVISFCFVLFFYEPSSAQIQVTKHTIDSGLNGAYWVYGTDINGNGKVDLVAASTSSGIRWYKNNGGSFSNNSIGSLTGAWSAFAADVDGDGDVDIMASSPQLDEVAWWKNNGGSSFGGKQTVDDQEQDPESIVSADLDGDGDHDLVVAAWEDGEIVWYEYKGGNNFARHTIDGSFSNAHSVWVSDIDRDGDVDVIAGSASQTKWYSNNGSGSFTKKSVGSGGALSVFAADVDGDGDPDVLRTHRNTGNIDWFENNGSGGFSQHVVAEGFGDSWSVSAGDFDGDGDMDIVAAGFEANRVTIWLNNGSEKFSEVVIDDNVNTVRGVFAADFDKDGDDDIAAAVRGDGDLLWYEMEGSGGPSPTITLDTPNGGEVLQAGSTFTIEWSSSGSINNVKIELSTDNGDTWSSVVGSTNNDGAYDWTVSDNPSDQCLIRVSDAADGNPSDKSNGTFTIESTTPAEITTTAPNGGEVLQVGSSFTITWTSSGDIANVKIEFSTDNGANWSTIVSSTNNDGSYNWTVPDNPSDQCLVRVSDASDSDPSDTSNGNFTIESGTITDQITVTAPDGGEVLQEGEAYSIQWSSAGNIDNVKIELSTDNGNSWSNVVGSTNNDGSYNWTVPGEASEQCLIRISDAADGDPSDVSNDVFTIQVPVAGVLTFTDVTGSAGLETEFSGTHGVSVADINGDGYPDIYINSQEDDRIPSDGYKGNYLFRNNGDGTFTRIENSAGVVDEASYAHGSMFFDMDDDGDFDLAVGHGLDGLSRRGLFRNNGDETFTQVDDTAGFENTGDIGTRSIVAGDLNGDGYVDIHFASFAGYDTDGYLGDGTGHFSDHTGLSDKDRSIQSMMAGDIDGDGDLDVIMGNFTSGDGLGYYQNDGSGNFTRVLGSGLPETGEITTANLADYDADGDLDVLTVNEESGFAKLYRNSNNSFSIATQFAIETGCSGGCGGNNGVFADFDNDGDLDLFLSTGVDKIWLNDGNGSFSSVSDGSTGLNYTLQDARFPVVLDYDKDGDLDLVVAQHDGPAILFRNNLNNGEYVRLRATGPLGDVGGFGTKVWAYEAGHIGESASLISYQEVASSGGYCIQHEPVVHLGTGSRANIDIRVQFINGNQSDLLSVTPGQILDVTTSDDAPPQISQVTASNISAVSALITWDTDESADSQVEYGPDSNYGSSTDVDAALVKSHEVQLSGLTANTTYHYRVKSKDASGNESVSGDFTFTTEAPDENPPIISSVTADDITASSATINWDTDEPADSQVEYGPGTNYGNLTDLDADLVLSHSVKLTGLALNTTYHFRVKSKDASANEAISSDFTFTTDSVSSYLQRVNAGGSAYTDVGGNLWAADQAFADGSWGYIGGNTYSTNDNIANTQDDEIYQTERYELTGYSFTVPGNGNYHVDLHFAEIYLKSPNQRIFDVLIEDVVVLHDFDIYAEVGHDAALVKSFETEVTDGVLDITFVQNIENPKISAILVQSAEPDETPPVISNVAASNIAATTVTIDWDTDEPADSQVEYGPDTSYGTTSTLYPTLITAHEVDLTGLSENTTYHYRVKSVDASGNQTWSGDFTFTTGAVSESYVQRVNAGGSSYDGDDGRFWDADQEFTDGSWGYVGGRTYSTKHAISGTPDDELYQSERFGHEAYRFTVPNGHYRIELLFAEIFYKEAGTRIFDVYIEDQLVLGDFDIYAEVGHDVALVKVFEFDVNDGVLDITFDPIADRTKISAIEVQLLNGNSQSKLVANDWSKTNEGQKIPTDFALSRNYPNPFNGGTQFNLALPEAGEVTAIIYNMLGQEIDRIYDGNAPAGHLSLRWNGLNSNEMPVSSGAYLLMLKFKGVTGIRKNEVRHLTLLK